MKRGMRKRPGEEEGEGLLLRLLAASIAAPLFALAMLLGLSVLGGRWAAHLFTSIPLGVHLLYAGLAAGVGLLFGFKGLTWLMGHLFMTHFEGQRNELVTAALWLIFAVLVVLAYSVYG